MFLSLHNLLFNILCFNSFKRERESRVLRITGLVQLVGVLSEGEEGRGILFLMSSVQ